MQSARFVEFLRIPIPIMRLWSFKRGRLLRISAAGSGTVVVTKSFSIRKKRHDTVIPRKNG